MDPFATLDELKARCDWTFDPDEERSAVGYLEEASDLVRSYGRAAWEPGSSPRMVKNIVISAVRRYMRNPEGLIQSRAGDETLAWRDGGEESGTIFLTKAEIKLVRGLAGQGGILSAQVVAWGNTRRGYMQGLVGAEQPFPYYASPDGPWAPYQPEQIENYSESPFPRFIEGSEGMYYEGDVYP